MEKSGASAPTSSIGNSFRSMELKTSLAIPLIDIGAKRNRGRAERETRNLDRAASVAPIPPKRSTIDGRYRRRSTKGMTVSTHVAVWLAGTFVVASFSGTRLGSRLCLAFFGTPAAAHG